MTTRWVLAILLAAAVHAGDLAARIESSLAPRYLTGAPPNWTIAERMAAHKTPGVSVAVIRNGSIVMAKGYGVLEAGGAPVNAETLFQAASISKPVAALAALHMMQHGQFTLDENVNGKLKLWKVPDNEFTAIEKVTLRRLLSHTAGLTVHGFPGYAQSEPLPEITAILDGIKPANTKPVRVAITPGTRYQYSGGGYTVMQQLLVDRMKKPFPEILKMIVLKNAGMTRSTYAQPLPPSLAANAARGHRGDGRKIEGNWHTYPEMAAAGLWTTPTDLAKFSIELWKAAQGKSSKIVEKSTALEMLTPEKGDYGLGVSIQGQGEGRSFGHNGANEGYRCSWVMFQSSGNGAVIMTNSDKGDTLGGELLRAIAVVEQWPALQPDRKIISKLDAALLAEYAGTYRLFGTDIPFKVKDGSLIAIIPGGRQFTYFPESDTRFFSQEGPPLEFKRIEGGVELSGFGERSKRTRP